MPGFPPRHCAFILDVVRVYVIILGKNNAFKWMFHRNKVTPHPYSSSGTGRINPRAPESMSLSTEVQFVQ